MNNSGSFFTSPNWDLKPFAHAILKLVDSATMVTGYPLFFNFFLSPQNALRV